MTELFFSKHFIYAELVRKGVELRYEIIPEFWCSPPTQLKKKFADLAWCVKSAETQLYEPKYLFEIEGANISTTDPRGMQRHIDGFSHIDLDRSRKIVVLYTRATSQERKKWDNNASYANEIVQRKKVAEEAEFTVIGPDDFLYFLKETQRP